MTHNCKQYPSSVLRGSSSFATTQHYPMAPVTTATTTPPTTDNYTSFLPRDAYDIYSTSTAVTTTTPHTFTRHLPRMKATALSGKTTELHQGSEIRPASRAAPCHLSPILVSSTDTTSSATQSLHTMAYPGYIEDHSSKRYPPPAHQQLQQHYNPPQQDVSASSSVTTITPTATVPAATPAPSIGREQTDGYLLFCADQRKTDNAVSLDQQWNKLSQTQKKEYHHRAIIINTKLEEEDDDNEGQFDNNIDADHDAVLLKSGHCQQHQSRSMTDQSNRSNLGGSSRLEHLVSPDAIREAEREEKEEGMGINAEHHPFSAYPSILSMKKHERRHSGSNSASPPLPPTLSPEQYSDDSPSPSSSATISSSSMGDKEDALVGSLEETSISGHSHGHYGPGCGISDKIDTAKDKRHQQPPIKERLKRPPNAYLLFNRDMRRRLLEESPKMTVAEISKEIGERWKRLDAERRQNYMQQAALIKQDHLKTHPDFIYTRRSKAQLAEARKFSRSRKGSHSNNRAVSMATTTATVVNIETAPTTTTSTSIAVVTTPTTTTLTAIPAGWPAAITTASTPTKATAGAAAVRTNQALVPHKRRRKSGMRDGPRDPRGRKKKRHRHPTAPKHPMSGFLFFLAHVRPEVARQYPGSTVGPISKVIASKWRDMTDDARLPWLQMAAEDKARYAREMRAYTASLDKTAEEDVRSLSAFEETTLNDPSSCVATAVHTVNGSSNNNSSICNNSNSNSSSSSNTSYHHHHHQQQQQQHAMYDPVPLSSSVSLPPKHITTTTTSTSYRHHPHPHIHLLPPPQHHHPPILPPGDLSDSSKSLYAVISGPDEYNSAL